MTTTPGLHASHVVRAIGSTAECLERNALQQAAGFFGCDPGRLVLDPYTTSYNKRSLTTEAAVTVRLAQDPGCDERGVHEANAEDLALEREREN
jgi:hypothetical protein